MPLSNVEIIHQDAALLVINKPTLLLSVPGRAEDNKDCLVTRLQDNGYPEARIVHRLELQQPARLRSDAEVYRLTAEFLQHPAVCASFDILPPQLGAAQVRSTQIESTQMQVTQQTPLTPPQERRT